MHNPVMADECVAYLVTNNNGTYVDLTFGAGGHSKLILEKLSDKGRLIAFDQDDRTLENAIDDPRFSLFHSNFRNLGRFAKMHRWPPVDGVMADLGMSSMQLDSDDRGFSFMYDAPLDMRMGQADRTAADVLNAYTADDLQQVFSDYGEVRNARSLAAAIVQARDTNRFETVQDLLHIVNQFQFGNAMRYKAQVFQALRIEVNDEVGALDDALQASLSILKPQGRLVVLTYHSLEDRLVKNFMKTGNVKGIQIKDDYGNIARPLKPINKKPILPTEEEIKHNSRARSAKLRVAEKQGE